MKTQQLKIEVKRLPISKLPDCYFKERLLDIAKDESVEINIVAKEGNMEDWAAYIGFPRYEELKDDLQKEEYQYYANCVSDPDGVMRRGDKLDADTAKLIFPTWGKLVYRR